MAGNGNWKTIDKDRFAEAIANGANAKKAAEVAGYKGKWSAQAGHGLLQLPKMKEKIRQLIAARGGTQVESAQRETPKASSKSSHPVSVTPEEWIREARELYCMAKAAGELSTARAQWADIARVSGWLKAGLDTSEKLDLQAVSDEDLDALLLRMGSGKVGRPPKLPDLV